MTTTQASTCRHGHSLTAANLRIDGKGSPRCRECQRLRNRATRLADKAEKTGYRHYEHRTLHPVSHYVDSPLPLREVAPIAVRWHVYRLDAEERRMSPGEILEGLRYWFSRKMAHSPEVLRCSQAMAARFTAAAKGQRWLPTILGDASIEDDGWVGMR